jgi:hypothetical protein
LTSIFNLDIAVLVAGVLEMKNGSGYVMRGWSQSLDLASKSEMERGI